MRTDLRPTQWIAAFLAAGLSLLVLLIATPGLGHVVKAPDEVAYESQFLLRELARRSRLMERGIQRSGEQKTPEQIRQMAAKIDASTALQYLQGLSAQRRFEGLIKANGALDDHETVIKWRQQRDQLYPEGVWPILFQRLTPGMKDQLLLDQLRSLETHEQLLAKRTRLVRQSAANRPEIFLDRLGLAVKGTPVVLAVVNANLDLFPTDNQTVRQVAQRIAAVRDADRQAKALYDKFKADQVVQRLASLEQQISELEAAAPKGWGVAGDRLYRWIHALPTEYHTRRVMALRERITRLRDKAQGATQVEQIKVQHQMDQGEAAAPLGRAAQALHAYFAALKADDFTAAAAMLVTLPSADPRRNRRYMEAYKRLAGATPVAEHAIGDCAIVILQEQDGPKAKHNAFLLKQNGVWKVSPRLTQRYVLDPVLDADQKSRMKELEAWARDFRLNPAGAVKKARPDLSGAPISEAVAAGHDKAEKGLSPTPAIAKIEAAKSVDPAIAAHKKWQAEREKQLKQIEQQNQASLDKLRKQIKDDEPYVRSFAEYLFKKAKDNLLLSNFYDPGRLALAMVNRHLRLQNDPRLKSSDAMEQLKARGEAREREKMAREHNQHYYVVLFHDTDRSQAIAPERIRWFAQERTWNALYTKIGRETTAAKVRAAADCVSDDMVKEFSGRDGFSMRQVNETLREHLTACQQDAG